ncbi:MAG: KOW domain-containing RNA-binding protein [Firmicutes bacterium]|nr:KOW domain-containing RNA-binding protein [Bacillota bacterium]
MSTMQVTGILCCEAALIGHICISKAGHDAGEIYVIVSVIDQNHIGVVDGRSKTIDKPKRKNRRHLWITKSRVVEIDRLLEGEVVSSNLKIASIIKALKFNQDGTEWKTQ